MLTDKQVEVAAMIAFQEDFRKRGLPAKQFVLAWVASRDDEIARVRRVVWAVNRAVDLVPCEAA